MSLYEEEAKTNLKLLQDHLRPKRTPVVPKPLVSRGGGTVVVQSQSRYEYKDEYDAWKPNEYLEIKRKQHEQVSRVRSLIDYDSDSETPGVEDISLTELLKNPSKVVLLKNMVQESDPELEAETKEECSKYGQVLDCVVHVSQSVLIFVEFARTESAIKAVVDLNCRFFGGRAVRALFYDQKLFKSRVFE